MSVLHTVEIEAGTLEVRAVDAHADLDRIWRWWTSAHVVGNWSMLFRLGPPRSEGPPYVKEDLRFYLERVTAETSELKPLILRLNGVEIGYSEEYRVGTSPLAKHPAVHPEDRGLHLMIGEQDYAGLALAPQILEALAKWQLTKFPAALKVMGDPDCRNQRAVKAVMKIPGAIRLDDYALGYKTATVFILAQRSDRVC